MEIFGGSRRGSVLSTEEAIGTSRLEAFSDGVMAVIITIMAFGLRAPGGTHLADVAHRFPALAVYILSYSFIGIYWNNHHHLLLRTDRISPAVMWANLHLLFWLSLIPVVTEWIGSSYRYRLPAATFGIVATGSAIAFSILTFAIVAANGPDSRVATALGGNGKGRVSMALYVAGIGLSVISPYAGYACYAAVSAIWFIPDRRLVR